MLMSLMQIKIYGPEVIRDLHFSVSELKYFVLGICSELSLTGFSSSPEFSLSPELGVNRHSIERHGKVAYNKFLCIGERDYC